MKQLMKPRIVACSQLGDMHEQPAYTRRAGLYHGDVMFVPEALRYSENHIQGLKQLQAREVEVDKSRSDVAIAGAHLRYPGRVLTEPSQTYLVLWTRRNIALDPGNVNRFPLVSHSFTPAAMSGPSFSS